MSLQPVKTKEQIQAMREGGQILAKILNDLRHYARAGLSGKQIDAWVGDQIAKYGAQATYKEPSVNFPGNICISVNDQIVHSIPTDYQFQSGDVVSFDLTITYHSMKVDSAFTMVIDQVPTGVKKHLLMATERALYSGISQVRAACRVGDISAAIEKVLRQAKLGIVQELVGHGVGNEMHMEPEIPNYGHRGMGPILNAGDTIAIEPMATLGSPAIKVADDGWSIHTRDQSLAAHFEHTVLVLDRSCEILTKLD